MFPRPVLPRRIFLLQAAAAAAAVAFHALPLMAQTDEAAQLRADMARELAKGDVTVYFRHGATVTGGVDRPEWPRERQRLLSEVGHAQAQAVGEAFRRHGWPVGEVLASPMARCRDMAEIAFGRVVERTELIGLLSADEGRQQRTTYSLDLLRTPAVGGNRIVVAHSSNIRASTGVSLPEGGAVLVRAKADGSGFDLLGQLSPQDWAALAAN